MEFRVIDEEKEPEAAKKFDYYYVPTYYVGDFKLYEGATSKEALKEALDRALE